MDNSPEGEIISEAAPAEVDYNGALWQKRGEKVGEGTDENLKAKELAEKQKEEEFENKVNGPVITYKSEKVEPEVPTESIESQETTADDVIAELVAAPEKESNLSSEAQKMIKEIKVGAKIFTDFAYRDTEEKSSEPVVETKVEVPIQVVAPARLPRGRGTFGAPSAPAVIAPEIKNIMPDKLEPDEPKEVFPPKPFLDQVDTAPKTQERKIDPRFVIEKAEEGSNLVGFFTNILNQ